MAEMRNTPASSLCAQWEALLTEALDGLLSPEDQTRFVAHLAACPSCAALQEQARRGRQWLEYLDQEPQPPAGLADKILAHTGPGHEREADHLAVASSVPAVLVADWRRPSLAMRLRQGFEPRLLMTVAMAFFSIALTLNMTGVRLGELRASDLQPANLRGLVERRLTSASTPIIRYYDHLRFVNHFESKVRGLRRGQQGEGAGAGEALRRAPQSSGESQFHPGPKESARPETTLQHSGNSIFSDALESSLTDREGPMHSSGSTPARRERSKVWIA